MHNFFWLDILPAQGKSLLESLVESTIFLVKVESAIFVTQGKNTIFDLQGENRSIYF